MSAVLSLTLETRDSKKVLWRNRSFTGFQDYTLTSDLNVARANKSNALSKLANDTAERAYMLMMSDF
jgi:hypothetical protein